MAFPASGILPVKAFDEVRQTAIVLRQTCVNYIATSASQNIGYSFLQAILFALNRANDKFDQLKTTPGLAEYAKAQTSDPGLDVAAEFTAMQGAISNAIAWLEANIITDVMLKHPSDWDSADIVAGGFTPAQTGGLRTSLQSVVDSIS